MFSNNTRYKYTDFNKSSQSKTCVSYFFSREFAKEKERVETRAGFMQLKEQQKLEKELNGSASLTSFMLDNKVDSIKVEKRLNSKKVD